MTGLHALHIVIGMVLLVIAYVKVNKGSIKHDKFVFLENGALYWHLVDLIWIFLFPLLYLIS
jgi:cytochrome c oxidase subunit 3